MTLIEYQDKRKPCRRRKNFANRFFGEASLDRQ